VSQVNKTSSSSGTYLCSMQGGSCGRWTLGGMFPPQYGLQFYYEENLSMARGKPKQTKMTAKINSILKSYLVQTFDEVHHWALDPKQYTCN
jgi:hypothetical protein